MDPYQGDSQSTVEPPRHHGEIQLALSSLSASVHLPSYYLPESMSSSHHFPNMADALSLSLPVVHSNLSSVFAKYNLQDPSQGTWG